MLLPMPVNRTALRGFWLFVSVFTGVLAALVLLLLGVNESIPLLAGVAMIVAILAVPGLLQPNLVWKPYRFWNWLARQLGAAAVRYVTAVCFFGVVSPLSRVTSPQHFILAPPERGKSMWMPRSTQSAAMYASLYHHSKAGRPSSRWTQPVRDWTRTSGHHEARTLLPFLRLSQFLDPQVAKGQPARRNIYTLY